LDWEGGIMGAAIQKGDLLERRQEVGDCVNGLWNWLTLAQKFSASNLKQFGYELSYVRDVHYSHVAVLTCNENIVIISKVGEIDTHPEITIRL
jgi:hypothetical protein